MPAAWERQLNRCKESTETWTSGKWFEVICWFKAMAKLSPEIIRRHQALAGRSIGRLCLQLKVSVCSSGNFQIGKGDHESSIFMGPVLSFANTVSLHIVSVNNRCVWRMVISISGGRWESLSVCATVSVLSLWICLVLKHSQASENIDENFEFILICSIRIILDVTSFELFEVITLNWLQFTILWNISSLFMNSLILSKWRCPQSLPYRKSTPPRHLLQETKAWLCLCKAATSWQIMTMLAVKVGQSIKRSSIFL